MLIASGILIVQAAIGAAAPAGQPAAVARAETLELTSGRVLHGRVVALGKGKLRFAGKGGLKDIRLADVARLVRYRGAAASRHTDGLVLGCGDVLDGDVIALRDGKLRVDSPRLGEAELPVAAVRALFFREKLGGLRERVPEADAAGVVMRSGSRTPAELRWVAGSSVGLSSPLGALTVRKSEVRWVLNKPGKVAKPAAGAVRLILNTGEVLTVENAELAAGDLKIRWRGVEATLPWDMVKRLESPGGRMVYLSSLEPSARKCSAAVGPCRPTQVNRCADGKALRVGGAEYEIGIGMRARSELSYALKGRWRRFRALAGLDQRAARASRGAVFVILADGKEIFRRKLRPGDKPVEVDLPVSSVSELKLVLEPGPGFEIGDYGNWADARLLR